MNTKARKWWDFWAAALLIAMLTTAATRLSETQWTKHLDQIQQVVLLGVIAGIALGVSRFRPFVAKLFGFVYTLFFIPWSLGVVLSPGVGWTERIMGLIGRTEIAARQFISSQPVPDPILFLLLMSILFWLLSITAGYNLTRHASPWATILPTGLVLMVINHYDRFQPSGMRLVGIFLFFAILLLGRLTFMRNRAEWQSNGIFLPPETSMDLGRASLVVGALLIFFAFATPIKAASQVEVNSFWSNISRPWEKMRERFGDAFSSLRAQVGEEEDFYGSNMALGTSTSLTDKVLFYVYPSDPPSDSVRYYWRARSYDWYSAGEWTTSYSANQEFTPGNFGLQYPSLRGRKMVEFSIQPDVMTQKTYYAPAMPLWISRPGEVSFFKDENGNYDTDMFTAQPAIRKGEYYRVRSWVSDPTITQLRMAGEDYPKWVTDRFLNVPVSVTGQVKTLAEQITKGLDTPYDKADAITKWLRENMTYSKELPTLPPLGTDPVEWFLFNAKAGYCNYYASAEILLLRSIGIPARISVGYAQGDWDPENEVFTVRQREAHAWPEVYFPGYGWTEFEPTVSQPERVLPLGTLTNERADPTPAAPPFQPIERLDQSVEMDGGEAEAAAQAARQAATVRQLIWLGSILAFGGIVALLYFRIARPIFKRTPLPVIIENNLRKRGVSVPRWLQFWKARALRSPFDKAYAAIERAIRLLGKKVQAAQTPSERALALRALLPEAATPVGDLVDEYHRAQFSPYPADIDRARKAGRDISVLSWKAFFRRLLTNRR